MNRFIVNTCPRIRVQSLFIIILLPFLVSINIVGVSQSKQNTDSLEMLLNSSAGDNRIEMLDKLSKQYLKINTAKSIEYSKEMLNYANNTIELQNKTKNDTVTADGYMLICNVNIIR